MIERKPTGDAPSGRTHSGKRFFRRAAFLFLLSSLVLPPHLYSAGKKEPLEERIRAQRQRLEKIRKEIERHRAKSKELRKKEKGLLRKLSNLEKEEALSNKLLAELKEREGLLGERIESLRERIATEGLSLAAQQEKLGKRLRQLYKRDPSFRWQFLLGSENLQEMLRRYKYLKLTAERDAELLEAVRRRKLSLEQEKALLTETLADVAALKRAREKERELLAKGKKERMAMLDRIRNERAKHKEAIRELKKSQEKLRDLLETMEKRRLEEEREKGKISGTYFARLKGKLMRPVEGLLIKSFGKSKHPKFGTVTFNSGVDIKAAPGTPIRVVARGTVEFVDWITGYGRCIIVNHGGGYYTLYAHAAEIFVKPTQVVSEGEVIAEVGDSGSVDGYECHFEIRKSKQALDPQEWFSK